MGTSELALVGLAGSGIGTALAVPMVWPRAERRAGTHLMGGWLLAVSATVALISARVIGWLPVTPAVEHAVNLLGLLAYPLLSLSVRQQTHLAPPQWSVLRLWIPAAVYVAALLVRSALGTGTRVPFAWMLPVLLLFTAACAALVLRREVPRRDEVVPAAWIVAFLVVLNVAQVVRMLFGHVSPVPALVPLVITLEFVAMVGLVAWHSVQARPAGTAPSETPRYERSGLDEDTAQALLSRIERALSADRLYTDTGLTLGRLAAAVESTPHQVSEVLNRYSKVTFHELLNRYRVEDVKAQLTDPSADRYTVEGIGASAGFGSRSALYAAFRRSEGVTPTEFRRRRT
jgi:AraC-like DNA-binding protein